MVSTALLFTPFGYLVCILTSPKTQPGERKYIFYLIPIFIFGSVAMLIWYQMAPIFPIYAETSVSPVFLRHKVTLVIH